MNAEKELLDLKKRIDDNKNAKVYAEGKREGYMLRLKKEFGYTSLQEATEALTKMQRETSQEEEKIAKKIEVLEEKI